VASIAEVVSYEVTDDGPVVQVDFGGGSPVTAEWFAPNGDDSPPLPGDSVAVERSDGTGVWQATACHDPANDGSAAPGEVRRYARNAAGVPVAEFHLKANGDIAITSLLPTGKINLNGVEIDALGNVTIPGTASALSVSAAGVDLATHLHTAPSGGGPTSPPVPTGP